MSNIIKLGDVLLIYQFPVENSLIVLVEDIKGSTINTYIINPKIHKKKKKLDIKKINSNFVPISFDTSIIRYLPGHSLALTILNDIQIEELLSVRQLKELKKIKKSMDDDVDLFA